MSANNRGQNLLVIVAKDGAVRKAIEEGVRNLPGFSDKVDIVNKDGEAAGDFVKQINKESSPQRPTILITSIESALSLEAQRAFGGARIVDLSVRGITGADQLAYRVNSRIEESSNTRMKGQYDIYWHERDPLLTDVHELALGKATAELEAARNNPEAERAAQGKLTISVNSVMQDVFRLGAE